MDNQLINQISLGNCSFRRYTENSSQNDVPLKNCKLLVNITIGCDDVNSGKLSVSSEVLEQLNNIIVNQFSETTYLSTKDNALEEFVNLSKKCAIKYKTIDGDVTLEHLSNLIYKVSAEFISSLNANCYCKNVILVDDQYNTYYSNHLSFLKTKQTIIKDKLGITVDAKDGRTEVAPSKPIPPPIPKEVIDLAGYANPLYGKVTPGYKNPFAGTSWGIK